MRRVPWRHDQTDQIGPLFVNGMTSSRLQWCRHSVRASKITCNRDHLLGRLQVRCFSGLRRQRLFERPEHTELLNPPSQHMGFGQLEQPYKPDEGDMDSYLKKTTLSPWVPMPEAVARKVLDISNAGPGDHHVDLGSGDGRVCFHALKYEVASSVGIDIDHAIVNVARERLSKRHPPPDNLNFVVADLLNESHPAWEEHIVRAQVITMYFVTEALEQLRPILERKLAGNSCRIVTCGYEVPGWQASNQEVVLGTTVYLYNWGIEGKDEEADILFSGPDILGKVPHRYATDSKFAQQDKDDSRFVGANILDKTGRFALRGFDPTEHEDYDDDIDDEQWLGAGSDSSDEDKRDM